MVYQDWGERMALDDDFNTSLSTLRPLKLCHKILIKCTRVEHTIYNKVGLLDYTIHL